MSHMSTEDVAETAKAISNGQSGVHMRFNPTTGDFEMSGTGDDQYFKEGFY